MAGAGPGLMQLLAARGFSGCGSWCQVGTGSLLEHTPPSTWKDHDCSVLEAEDVSCVVSWKCSLGSRAQGQCALGVSQNVNEHLVEEITTLSCPSELAFGFAKITQPRLSFKVCVPELAWPLACCVIEDKSFNLSGPVFSSLKWTEIP